MIQKNKDTSDIVGVICHKLIEEDSQFFVGIILIYTMHMDNSNKFNFYVDKSNNQYSK